MRPWIIALYALGACGLGAWLALRLRAWRERRLGRARQTHGKQGEQRAECLLQAHRYTIVGRQVPLNYVILVDKAPLVVELVVDLVVERGGERLLAEVKTGAAAPRLERAETRRQLLEYQLASGTRSILLVNPDAQTIVRVAFPLARPQANALAWATSLTLVAICAATVGYLAR